MLGKLIAIAALSLGANSLAAAPTLYRIDPLSPRPLMSSQGSGGIGVTFDGTFELDPDDFINPPAPFIQARNLSGTLNITFLDDPLLTSFDIPLTGLNATYEFNTAATVIDGNTVSFNTALLAPFTTIFQLTTDNLPMAMGFPNGRRVGDDNNDLVLVSLFTGSINAGFVAFEGGFGGPTAEIATGRVTPGDSLVFARAVTPPVAAVPLPAGLWLLLASLGGLWLHRRA